MNTRDQSIAAWLAGERELALLRKKVSNLETKAHDAALPEHLRQATASDIVENAIIWYKHGDEGHFWQMVEEVLRPSDSFKAYVANDGCRYGLDDAWVELE